MRQHHPTVVVLSGGDPPPGMDAVRRHAAVRQATDDRLADELPGAEILFVWRLRPDTPRTAWPKADSLRWVHTASADPGPLLTADVIANDVVITSSRGLFDEPIAEYVLGLILTFAKDLHGRIRLQEARTWRRGETERVAGKRALVVGTGSIGRAIGRTLRAVGMQVTGLGRIGRVGDRDFGTVLPMDRFTDGLRGADYVVLAAPLTVDTRGMLDRRALSVMKPTARVINISRGGLLVLDHLIPALRGGKIAGAALDVFSDEQLDESSPLWEMDNVLISPHMSGQVVGWQEELVALFADNLARYVEGLELRNVVDRRRLL